MKPAHLPNCESDAHDSGRPDSPYSSNDFEAGARLFRALGDESRLRLLEYLSRGEACVSEIAEKSGEGLSTVSQRLRILRMDGLVNRRREGKHLFYRLTDHHIEELIRNGLEHIGE